MLRSILLGLDGSACSNAAVELGTRWARRFDALLVGLGIVDESTICRREPVPIGAGHYKTDRDQWLLEDARRRVEGLLDRLVRRCAAEGVECRVVCDVGPADAQIVQKSRLCDLIMIGQPARSRSEPQNWPDATLREVLRRSSRPVVAVPESLQEGRGILVAYDGSPQADRALQAFLALGPPGEEPVHLLSVQPDQADAERLTAQAVGFIRLHGVEAAPLPFRSTMSADRIIISQMRNLQPRLLVMGAYGRSPWQEFLFGSVTSRILEASGMPLLLCR